jgi:hypothetical protein
LYSSDSVFEVASCATSPLSYFCSWRYTWNVPFAATPVGVVDLLMGVDPNDSVASFDKKVAFVPLTGFAFAPSGIIPLRSVTALYEAEDTAESGVKTTIVFLSHKQTYTTERNDRN